MQVILNKAFQFSVWSLFFSQQPFIRNSRWVLLFPLTRIRETWHQQRLRWSDWYQQEPAADGNGERTVQIRRCPAAVKRLHHGRQSERPPVLQPTRIDP